MESQFKLPFSGDESHFEILPNRRFNVEVSDILEWSIPKTAIFRVYECCRGREWECPIKVGELLGFDDCGLGVFYKGVEYDSHICRLNAIVSCKASFDKEDGKTIVFTTEIKYLSIVFCVLNEEEKECTYQCNLEDDKCSCGCGGDYMDIEKLYHLVDLKSL